MRRFLPLLLACACHTGTQKTPTDGGGDLPDGGHALPGPGRAAAWRVLDPAELVRGPATGGRVGDWEMANSRIRVVIEDSRPSDGFDPYGCSIASADRQRDGGAESRFGEVWMGLNFRTAGCDQMLLVNDGRDGEPAVLRAEGHDEESPFMASLFTVAAQPTSLHASVFREYSLAPDADALQLNLTIRNDDGSNELHIGQAYVGMAMNRGLRHWVDKSGFDFDFSDLARVNTSAEFYAAVGDKVSYSVLNLDAPFSPILNFAHVLIGQYPEARIPPGQAKTFRFALGVGTGDTGSLQVAHAGVRGAQSDLVALSGFVIASDGTPVAAARVHVTNAAGDQAIACARTAADGSWTSPVRSGTYGIRALANDRPGSTPQTITVTSAGLTNVTLQLGATSRIDATATDALGQPIPAKIVFEPAVSNVRPTLPPALGEMWDRQPIVMFSPDGRASAPVFPGQWHVTFSRGFEYDRPVSDVTALPGSPVAVPATLKRVVDTTGWVSGDFHVHAQLSPDADDLLELKVRAFAGEGVEVPVSTEHEFIGDFGPTARALGLAPFMHTIPGTEMTTTATGHFNIFPLTPIATALNTGGFNWYNRTVPAVIAEARTRLTPGVGAPIVQMNHPRTPGMAYLSAVLFDPNSFTATANPDNFMTAWDAMEVWNGVPIERFEGCAPGIPCGVAFPTAFDWFSFLDRGLHVTGTGNSDSHNASLREVGYPRTYLHIGSDDPATIKDSQISAAVRGMEATISGGPFLTISVGNVGIGSLAQPDSSSVVQLKVDVQAPEWMGPLSRLDIWQGDTSPQGAHVVKTDTMSTAIVTGPLRSFSKIFPIAVTSDTWFIATVRGPVDNTNQSHALWPVVQSPVPPFAITNPIWIDANTDGKWTPLRQ